MYVCIYTEQPLQFKVITDSQIAISGEIFHSRNYFLGFRKKSFAERITVNHHASSEDLNLKKARKILKGSIEKIMGKVHEVKRWLKKIVKREILRVAKTCGIAKMVCVQEEKSKKKNSRN